MPSMEAALQVLKEVKGGFIRRVTWEGRKVGFVVFAAVLVVPEMSGLTRDGLQTYQLPALAPNRLP